MLTPEVPRAESRAPRALNGRRTRLLALGFGIATGAGVLACAAIALIAFAWRWGPSAPAVAPPVGDWVRAAAAFIAAMAAGGTAGGLLAGVTRPPLRAERAGIRIAVGASVVWAAVFVGLAEPPADGAAHWLAVLVAGPALGLLSAVALWDSLTAAVRRESTFVRAVWAGARRLAALALALVALLVAAPLTLWVAMLAGAFVLRGRAGVWPDWAWLVSAWAAAIAMSLLCLRLAGVPRRRRARSE